MTFTIATIPTPAPEAEPSWVVDELVRIDEAYSLDGFGTLDHAQLRSEWIPGSQPTPDARMVRLVALDGEGPTEVSMDASLAGGPHRLLGMMFLELALVENRDLAWGGPLVDPSARRRGVGMALQQRAEQVAREHGCIRMMGWSVDAETAGPLSPVTGAGTYPASPAALFAQSLGATLEQINKRSVCPLPVDADVLEPMLVADPGYDTVTFEYVPEEYVDDVCWLWQRMADAPQGELGFEETQWTPERLRAGEELRRSAGRRGIVTAAREKATGTLVGFTGLYWNPLRPELVEQGDTIVLAEHRGHRLGWLIKATNIVELLRENPAAERISTWNATENNHMLAINETLGFAVESVAGVWQKRL